MNPEAVCQRFADDLLQSDPPSAELASHLAICETCRETRQAFTEVRLLESTFPAAEVDRLTDLVLTKSLPAASPAQAPRPPLSLPPILAGITLGLVLGGLAWWGFHHPPEVHSPIPAEIPGQPGPDRGQAVVIVEGSRDLDLPDGSKARLVGNSSARVLPGGLELYWGTAEITTRSPETRPIAVTPHCRIAGSKGTFTCQAFGSETRIISKDALLSVTPRDGPAISVRPGETREVAGYPGETQIASRPRSLVLSPDGEGMAVPPISDPPPIGSQTGRTPR